LTIQLRQKSRQGDRDDAIGIEETSLVVEHINTGNRSNNNMNSSDGARAASIMNAANQIPNDVGSSGTSDSSQNPVTPRSQKTNIRTFQPQLPQLSQSLPAARQSTVQSPVIKAGFLRKKGAKRRNWTKRWFELKGHSLTYFKNEKADKLKGSIVLDLAVVGKSHRKPFGFFVRTPERILMLWPINKEERDMWIEAITSAITVQYYGVAVDIEQSVWAQKFISHVNDRLYKSAIKWFK